MCLLGSMRYKKNCRSKECEAMKVIILEEAIESITLRSRENDPSFSSFLLKGASAFEIVRCKDCKWHEHGGLPCPLDAFESLDDDGYCSRGERSE